MLELIRKYPRLLLFGILTAMFSGPGQTFLVSFFLPSMRESFSMSQTKIAFLYALATAASAFLLPWVGRMLDRTPLVWFTLIAGFLLSIGCLVLSKSTGVITVLIGFLLIRNLGQGTLAMISSTTMARVFGTMRGKALGIANLGYPLGEAIFPYVITSWILVHGWRSGWVLLAILMLIFFSPAILLLMKNNPHEDAKNDFQLNELNVEMHGQGKSWTVKEMMTDWHFYFLMVPLIIAPAFLTALFFHQVSLLSQWKGWSLQWISAGFMIFAISRITVSFLSGWLIDKFSARRIFPLTLVPMALGILFLLGGDSIGWCFAYLTGAGISMGFAFTVTGALFVEIYGTDHLGAIKGLISSVIVLSTAVSPPIMGALLDHAVHPPLIFIFMALFTLVGACFAWVGCIR